LEKFQILDLLLKQPKISQKKISDICSISIGKVNYTINHLIEEGFIETKKAGKTFQYIVTPKGKEYLKNQLHKFQEAKINLHLQQNQVTQAVILAAGQKTDFDKPVCLLEFDGMTLLERTINILEKNGIKKIMIVTGYKSEAFHRDKIQQNQNVIFLQNNKFLWNGTMASLAMVKDYVTDDFLLIEDDILIEENAINQLLKHPERDCILVTKESGSGDEAFIEIKNGYLYKISKDIHQLNRIDGEMIGVTKISYEVFNEMMKLYKHNKNPYLNYEYLLLDVSRTIDIGFLKIPDLIWAEIDTQEHYQIVQEKIWPMLKRKEAAFKELELKSLIANALNIEIDAVTAVQPFGGMTNKNYKVTINGDNYVVRIPGNGTQNMINRSEEKYNSELASKLGINPEQLYFNEETGMKITTFIPNSEALNAKTAKREEHLILIANIFKKLHQSNVKMKNTFDVFEKIEHYEKLAIDSNGIFFEDYFQIKDEINKLKDFYKKLKISLAPCHNDPVPENFVKSGEDKIYLIDWEYGGMNDPIWDIAAFSLECEFSPTEEELLLNFYFGDNITTEIRQRLLLNKIFQDFLWSIWTVYKEANGDDFGSYGMNRYTRAKNNITKFYSLFKGADCIEQV
jgi:thiamine kinase-like enzyme/choline kinase/predicted transcriptional regulator